MSDEYRVAAQTIKDTAHMAAKGAYVGTPAVYQFQTNKGCLQIGGHIIEPHYEMFTGAPMMLLNGHLLYLRDARSTAAYRMETFTKGWYRDFDKACEYAAKYLGSEDLKYSRFPDKAARNKFMMTVRKESGKYRPDFENKQYDENFKGDVYTLGENGKFHLEVPNQFVEHGWSHGKPCKLLTFASDGDIHQRAFLKPEQAEPSETQAGMTKVTIPNRGMVVGYYSRTQHRNVDMDFNVSPEYVLYQAQTLVKSYGKDRSLANAPETSEDEPGLDVGYEV